jgi:protein SCO1/2
MRPGQVDQGVVVRVLVAAVVAAAALSGCAGHRGDDTPRVGTQIQRSIPPEVGRLLFVGSNGTVTSLSSLRGSTIVLADFLTLCQEICPLTTAELGHVQQDIRRAGLAGHVVIMEVTVDPARDTPARLAAYQTLVGAGPNWRLLTGSAIDVAALWRWFGVAYERQPEAFPPAIDWWTGRKLTYDVGHTDVLFVIDPAGTERYVVTGPAKTPLASVPTPLAGFLSVEGRANLSSPSVDAWNASDVDALLTRVTGHRVSAD